MRRRRMKTMGPSLFIITVDFSSSVSCGNLKVAKKREEMKDEIKRRVF
jgi:hypothetical protein